MKVQLGGHTCNYMCVVGEVNICVISEGICVSGEGICVSGEGICVSGEGVHYCM